MPEPEQKSDNASISAPGTDKKESNSDSKAGRLFSRGAKVKARSGITPWWVYLAIFILVTALTGSVWWMIFTNRGGLAVEAGPTPRPMFVIITSTPTSLALDQEPQSALTPTPTTLSLPDETPEGPTAAFSPGDRVEITGTEGAGLSIRSEPGTGAETLSIGFDGDVFVITEGPLEADGYQWWAVAGEGDDSRAGWVVEDFLSLTTSP